MSAPKDARTSMVQHLIGQCRVPQLFFILQLLLPFPVLYHLRFPLHGEKEKCLLGRCYSVTAAVAEILFFEKDLGGW